MMSPKCLVMNSERRSGLFLDEIHKYMISVCRHIPRLEEANTIYEYVCVVFFTFLWLGNAGVEKRKNEMSFKGDTCTCTQGINKNADPKP